MTVLQWLRELVCDHHVRVDLVSRVSPELVTCPCTRCGKLLKAPYGAALNAKWDPAPPIALWRER